MLKIRTYPHFDADLSLADAEALVTDPAAVAAHAFHPFIEFSESWTKFAAKGISGKPKSRPIKYASRRDSCIYSHYRASLIDAYEAELSKREIGHAVLAYRRLAKSDGRGHKCNVHFAHDVFSTISSLESSLVYTLDISKFFESLDHRTIKRRWMQLIGVRTMPADHYCVFRSITRYAAVNRERLYTELKFIGTKSKGNTKTTGYLVKRVPLQVCSANDFRNRVVPLIYTNTFDHGIPQGCPMSDVLANIYMLDFDTAMVDEVTKLGGFYYRYSDDILLVIPGLTDDHSQRLKWVETTLAASGEKLSIQAMKSTVHKFFHNGSHGMDCVRVHGTAGRNGLEYLGFRFDGKRVYIRDSTRSRLQRKMTYAVNGAVRKLDRENPGSGRAQLKKLFKPSNVLRQFYKIRDFETVADMPSKWTFWTYVIKAQGVFGAGNSPIRRQVRNFRRSIISKAEKEIDKLTKIP
jgi:hypothetical protein